MWLSLLRTQVEYHSPFCNHSLVIPSVLSIITAAAIPSGKEEAGTCSQPVFQIGTNLEGVKACRDALAFILKRFDMLKAEVSADE